MPSPRRLALATRDRDAVARDWQADYLSLADTGRTAADNRPARPSFALIAVATLAAFALGGALAALPALTPATPSVAEIIATTATGDSYVAGSGHDCASAWDRAELPADWHSLVCNVR